jgi:hypothetical protein
MLLDQTPSMFPPMEASVWRPRGSILSSHAYFKKSFHVKQALALNFYRRLEDDGAAVARHEYDAPEPGRRALGETPDAQRGG